MPTPPPPPVSLRSWRKGVLWVAVVVLSGLLLWSNYFTTSTITAVASQMQQELRIDDLRYGVLASSYSLFPLLGSTLLSGVLCDRLGSRLTSLISTLVVCLGSSVLVLSGTSLWRKCLGYAVFGLGAEALSVVQAAVLYEWFGRGSLSLATAAAVAVYQTGSVVALMVGADVAERAKDHCQALWLAFVLCCAGTAVNSVRVAVDKWFRSSGQIDWHASATSVTVVATPTGRPEPDVESIASPPVGDTAAVTGMLDGRRPSRKSLGQFKQAAGSVVVVESGSEHPDVQTVPLLSDKKSSSSSSLPEGGVVAPKAAVAARNSKRGPAHLCRRLGLRLALLIFGGSCFYYVWVWTQFTTLYLVSRWQVSNTRAAKCGSIIFWVPFVGGFLCGMLIDRFGRRMLAVSVAFCLLISSHLLLTFAPPSLVLPEIAVLPMGVGYAIFTASYWPSLPLVVPGDILGLAYGISGFSINVVFFVAPLAYGGLRQSTGSYLSGQLMMLGVSALGILSTVVTTLVDSNHGGALHLPSREALIRSQAVNDGTGLAGKLLT